jgi:hypothetical protein
MGGSPGTAYSGRVNKIRRVNAQMKTLPLAPAVILGLFLTLHPQVAAPQNPDPGALRCGERKPLTYAVVFDASSSLWRHETEVVDAYARILRVLAEVQCQGEARMQVYTFPDEDGEHMHEWPPLRPGGAQRALATQIAQRLLRSRTPHSDLPLVVRSIALTVRADVVFLVTDGSYYPHPLRRGETISLDAVRDSLTVLEDSIIAIARRPGTPLMFSIGVRSEHEPAIDPALRARLSAPLDGDWTWQSRNGQVIHLDTASGGALLQVLFRRRYLPVDSAFLSRFLFGEGAGAWMEKAGYRSGAGLRVGDLQGVRVEHLVALPTAGSGGAASCPDTMAAPGVQTRPAGAYGGRVFCSIPAPDPATLHRLASRSWDEFAFRQVQVPGFDSIPGRISGYHQLALDRAGERCTPRDIRQHLEEGRPWPDATARTGWMRLVRLPDRWG